MKEKQPTKISLTTAILIIIVIIALIFDLLFFIYHIQTSPSSYTTSITSPTSITTIYSDTKKAIPENSNTNYNIYSASVKTNFDSYVELENIFVSSNNELNTYLRKYFGTDLAYFYNDDLEMEVTQYFNDDFFEKYNLAIQMYDASSSHHSYSVISVIKEDSKATINIHDNYHTYGGVFPPSSKLVFIALDKNIKSADFDIYRTTTNNSHDSNFGMMFIAGFVISVGVIILVSLITLQHNKKIDNMSNLDNITKTSRNVKKIIIGIIVTMLILLIIFFAIVFYEASMTFNPVAYKPIIYLYPTEQTKITVQLGNPENITCSYPNYTSDGWNVIAYPDGNLTNTANGKNLYSLYYENTNAINFKIENDGFIVKGSDVSTFLEEKLSILGLTDREAEEFIVYWLPKLQKNKYNYIRFATMEEINKNMPIGFSVQPDTLIRILMTYKKLDTPINVEEQQLKAPERTGFVAVEWGGTEIK